MSLLHAYIFNLLILAVQSYYWYWVRSADGYHPDTVYHQSSSEGSQACCRVGGWASGRDHRTLDSCRIPSGHKEHAVSMPFQVLAREPLKESMVWRYTTSPAEIRAKGVVVKTGGPEPEMYVCADRRWGPGKLVIWDGDDVRCYVAYYWKEQNLDRNYQVLMAEPANQYRLTKVNYHMNDLDMLEDTPLHMAEATLVNNDDSDHLLVHTLTYKKTSTKTWQSTEGFTTGTSITVTAGVPSILSTEWTVSTQDTYEYSNGESHEETVEVSSQARVTVPAQHSCKVSIVARRKIVDVPYDATVYVYYARGRRTRKYITGVYRGMSVSQDSIQVDECIPDE